MPIVVTQPVSDQPFGQGWVVDVTTDFVGAIGNPLWTATIEVLDGGIEVATVSDAWRPTDPHLHAQHIFVFQSGVQPPMRLYHDGLTANLHVELLGDAGFHESTQVPIEIDTVEGPVAVLSKALADLQTAVSGGFTETDRETIEATQQATQASFGEVTSPVIQNLGGLVAHPPVGFMKLQVLPIVGSGDGAIDGDANLLPTIYGLWWEFTDVPPGIGFLEGPTRHYSERMLQLRAIYTINGVEVVGELVDADYDRVIWLWREAKPTRIEYHLLPGVTATFAYLQII